MPAGARLFLFVNQGVVKVMDCATAGSEFLFGLLAVPPGQMSAWGEKSLGFFLAFQALPTIIFFSSLVSILYYIGLMLPLVRMLSSLFTKLLNVSGAESLVAISNIFAGVESALTVKPYLENMTRSELCVVLTTGMATVSSNVLSLYVFSLQSYFPTIAGHLISASLLSCPAAVIMSKLLVPETGVPETLGAEAKLHYERDGSFFEAIINGANSGVKMIVGIAALLMAVLGLVALADLFLSFLGHHINAWGGWGLDWSLKHLCGYLFYPFTYLMGIAPADVSVISRIIGERLILTEVVSYQDLAAALAQKSLRDPRSVVICTYALCGFAHVASMSIFVGGTAALVPGRTRDLTHLALRTLLAATLACLMTACVAGTFFTNNSILFSGG